MTASPIVQFPAVQVAARVSALSIAAPYAVPKTGFGAGVIRLVSGAPAPEALPFDDLRQAAQQVLGDPVDAAAALGYGPHAGLPELRQWIADREAVDVDQVLVTNGALHGISLTFGALLEAGDVVVLDDPIFPDTVRIAEHYGATVLPVRVGNQGIDVDAIAGQLAAGIKIRIVYTVADFHNPSGGVLPSSQRQRLVALAERYGFVIVSDNPYRETTFDGTYQDDFDATSSRVVRVGSSPRRWAPGSGWAG